MTERKTVLTEAEARILLREVAAGKEDERAIDAYTRLSRRRRLGPGAIAAVAFLVLLCGPALAFLERPGDVPIAIWGALICLAVVTASQSTEIGRLTKVTAALARTSGRSRAAEPLPRAPSPSA